MKPCIYLFVTYDGAVDSKSVFSLQSESALPGQGPTEAVTTPQSGLTAPLNASAADPATTPLAPAPPLLSSPALDPTPTATPATPTTPSRPVRRRRRGSRGSSPARRGARNAAAKRRGRPPNTVFQELEQQYFTQMVVKPIPTCKEAPMGGHLTIPYNQGLRHVRFCSYILILFYGD